MAVHLLTDASNKLLAAFKKAIDDGHVATWSYDKDGDFTHTAQQWKDLAWFRPSTQNDRLVMNIMRPQNQKVSPEVYAVYHGRIIESMLAHCDRLFDEGWASALAESGDSV